MGIQNNNGSNVGLLATVKEMKLHPEERDIILGKIAPQLPKKCLLVYSETKVSLILMEEVVKFISEGRLKELQAYPKKLCVECREKSFCHGKKH